MSEFDGLLRTELAEKKHVIKDNVLFNTGSDVRNAEQIHRDILSNFVTLVAEKRAQTFETYISAYLKETGLKVNQVELIEQECAGSPGEREYYCRPRPRALDESSSTKLTEKEIDDRFFACVDAMCERIKEKLHRKRHDYGRENILRHREYGVLVRKDDKMSRVANLFKPGVNPMVEDESVADTILDDIGYDLIMLALMQNSW